jgi:hypothetical protein
MNVKKYVIVLFVAGTLAGAFAAGYLGNRFGREQAEAEKESTAGAPRPIEAVREKTEIMEMDALEYKIQEEVDSAVQPYRREFERWDQEKKTISARLDKHERELSDLEEADAYFQEVAEDGVEWLRNIEDEVYRNKTETNETREEVKETREELVELGERLGPGESFYVRMVYPTGNLEGKYDLSAYDNRLYVEDLLNVVEEWQKNPVNRLAIVDRPQARGKAVFFAGADNSFAVEIVKSAGRIDMLVMLSSTESIHRKMTISRTEAKHELAELFAAYGSAYCVPVTQIFKKPAFALLFGARPDIGRHQGKFYVR